MFKKLQGVDLVPVYDHAKARLYRLDADKLNNHYYIVTSATTRHLLNSPEVVGFEEGFDYLCQYFDDFARRLKLSAGGVLLSCRHFCQRYELFVLRKSI